MSPKPASPAACVFCAIVAGELAAHVVAETEHTVAFLDRRPLFPGHTLVVPREHVVTLRDLPDALLVPFFTEVRRIAATATPAIWCARSFATGSRVAVRPRR